MEKVRVGILGVGNIGTVHGNNILDGHCPEFILSAVCDLKAERLQWVKENWGGQITRFNCAEQMLDSGLIDACIISVPHYDHPKYAIACMKRGIHVMLEKPAGVYTRQVRQMNEEAKKHNVVFGMMFNQRGNHIYRKMHELVHSGKYGQIRRTNWLITNWYRSQAYYDSGDWRATWAGEGGGVLLNQCPHQLDLWQWICGMPISVHAHMKYGQWHNIEVEDDVTAFVEYENGATGVFITSTGDACGSNRFEIQMDKAKLVAENNQLFVYEFEQTEQEFSAVNKHPFGRPKAIQVTPETDGLDPQHAGALNAWAGAILRGEPLVAHGCEGINGLTLSNAMHLSDWTNSTIMLPLDEDLFYEELMKRVATSSHKSKSEQLTVDISDTFAGTTCVNPQ